MKNKVYVVELDTCKEATCSFYSKLPLSAMNYRFECIDRRVPTWIYEMLWPANAVDWPNWSEHKVWLVRCEWTLNLPHLPGYWVFLKTADSIGGKIPLYQIPYERHRNRSSWVEDTDCESSIPLLRMECWFACLAFRVAMNGIQTNFGMRAGVWVPSGI